MRLNLFILELPSGSFPIRAMRICKRNGRVTIIFYQSRQKIRKLIFFIKLIVMIKS